LLTALHGAWNAKTGYANENWSADNPARGQCVVTSLVVQDYLGGDLVRFAVTGEGINEKHYCNVLEDGTLIDVTRSQYRIPVTMRLDPVDLKNFSSMRERRLADEETHTRYEYLKKRVAERLHTLADS
jgi:hypothetical protein